MTQNILKIRSQCVPQFGVLPRISTEGKQASYVDKEHLRSAGFQAGAPQARQHEVGK